MPAGPPAGGPTNGALDPGPGTRAGRRPQLEPAILAHTIGQPASYASEHEAGDLLDRYVGWISPEEVTVGQGKGRNSVGISLETQQTTAKQRSWSVTFESEFTSGPAAFGASVGVTGADLYTVSVSEGTRYEGSVGDISDPADYAEWLYRFGLLAYERGVLCDDSNQPIGTEEGCVPFQVVTYWTNPTGAGY